MKGDTERGGATTRKGPRPLPPGGHGPPVAARGERPHFWAALHSSCFWSAGRPSPYHPDNRR